MAELPKENDSSWQSRPFLFEPDCGWRCSMNGSDHTKHTRVKTIGGALILLWLALVLILGADGAFARGPGALPLPILTGMLAPILVFLIANWTVGPFRDFVMSIDLPVMAGI
jgi:hypothetical protein